jgi:hypothetical protein
VDFNAYASQGKPEAMDEIVFPSTVKVMEHSESYLASLGVSTFGLMRRD